MKAIKSKILLFLGIIAVLSMSFPLSSSAFYTSPQTSNNVIKVGYYENELFEEGASEGAEKKGYAYEYMRKISEYTGWKYEYIYGDFVDIYQMLLDGKVDLVAGLAYTEDRSSIILYPDRPMGYVSYGLIKHESDDSITYEYSTINNKTIGVLESAIENKLNDFLADNQINAKVVTYPNYEKLFLDFNLNKIDLIAAENDGTYARNHAEVLFNFGENEYFLCTNTNRKDILTQLNNAQGQLFSEEPDFISSIRSKYYSASFSSKAFTSAEKQWISDNSSIKVGYLNNYLPYSATDKNGNVNGMVKDIVPDIFSNLGLNNVSITYTAFNDYEDMMEAVANEDIDIAFPVGGGLFYSEEDGIYISTPLISPLPDLIYNNKYKGATTSTFAVNEKNKMQYYYIKSNFPDATIKTYSSIDSCLKAVVNGEVQFTTLNGLRTSDMLKNNDYASLSFRQLSNVDDRCFGVKIGNEGLLKLINRGLNIVSAEYVQNIAYAYTEEIYTYSFWDIIKDNIFSIIAAFVFIMGFGIYFLVRYIKSIHKKIEEKETENRELVNFYENKLMEDDIETVSFKGMRLLIVEDNTSKQIVTSKVFKKIGFEIQIAVNGMEAYEKIKAAPAGYFNAVLMDINSPDLDGKEAARMIRSLEDPDKANISIVAVDALL